jgi:hypothetical protein
MTARRRWIVRHLLPAGGAVRTLVKFFRRSIRMERELEKLGGRRRMELEWYAQYSPTDYLSILESEALIRAYSYLLMTLRKHVKLLSEAWRPEHWLNPKRRFHAWWRHSRAPDALEAVGAWWLEVNRSRCPRRSRHETKALRLCTRIRRLQEEVIGSLSSGRMERFKAALTWMSAELKEDLRK